MSYDETNNVKELKEASWALRTQEKASFILSSSSAPICVHVDHSITLE